MLEQRARTCVTINKINNQMDGCGLVIGVKTKSGGARIGSQLNDYDDDDDYD